MISPLQSRLVSADESFEDKITPWMGQLAPWTRRNTSYDDDKARNWFLICVIVSMLLHLGILMLPITQRMGAAASSSSAAQGPLTVHLANPAPRTPPAKSEPVKETPPPPQQAKVIAAHPRTPTKPSFVVPPQPEKPVPQVQPVPQTPPQEDMMAHKLARHAQIDEEESRAAAINQAAAASDGPSTDQVIAANLNRAKHSANDGTGGVFQITSVGVREGSFRFNGWNPARDNWHESYTVDAGIDGDVKLAIVKKVIEVIRKYKKGDFEFESHRLGRMVPMSARPQDNDRLESFLLMELFDQDNSPSRRHS